MKSQPQNVVPNPQSPNASKDTPLPTPVSVKNLELALSGHPDHHFVLQLCNNFKQGVRIGFQGQRAPKFSKKFAYCFC
jgi:hypothetical protein